MNVGVATAGADDLVIDTTTQTFRKDVLEESRRQPVVVDFWAPWCGPCKQLTPVLEKAVHSAKGAVRLAKMNIDDHPSIAGQLGIQSIPAVIAFINGQPADGFMGALPESQVIAFLERVTKQEIGGEEKELLKAADEALVAGDPAAASELYSEVLAGDPATSTRPSIFWNRRPNPSGTTARLRPPGLRSKSPNRRPILDRSPNWNRRLPPTRSTTRRDSISRWR
jgi:thioredoxin